MPDALPLDPLLYARVGPLLDQALDVAPELRTEWLASLRDESPEVVATLAKLLAQDNASDEFLPSGPGRYSLEHLLGGWATSMAGTPVGAWTLDEPIGQGGMGTVWLAHRADGTFSGRAAIKLLHLSSVTPLALERFRSEGTLLATLSHPNIARLLDAGVTDAGQPYLVMEYVDGLPLDVYAQQQKLTQVQRLALIQQTLDALTHAHAHLIVHRDLKPSNILVRPNGRVTLLDFGIGKQLLDSPTDAQSAVTQDGGRALTPLFASPEQLRGDAIGTASDTYSAGVVAYQLLTGVHPTAGESRTTTDIMRTTLEAEPRRSNLGDLDTVLRRALKKMPSERYETAAAFNDDLQRYVEHKPVRARPDTLAYRVHRFVQRNRVGVAGASLAILALMATTGVAVRQARVAARERDNALFQSERAETIRQFQTVLLSQISTTPLNLKQLLDKGMQTFDAGQTTDPRITVSLLMNFADRYAELELPQQELSLLLRADSVARISADASTKFATVCALALHYADQHQLDPAQREIKRSDVIAGASDGAIVPLDRVTCLMARARVLDEQNVPDSALALTRQAVATLEQAGRGNTMQMISTRVALAGRLSDLNFAREAVAELELQRSALARMGLEGSLPSTAVLANLTNAQSTLGERAAVLPVLRRVNELLRSADSASGINQVTGYNFAAELLADDQVDSALVWFRAVAATAVLRKSPVVEYRANFGVIRSLARLGRGAEAAPVFARYLAMLRALGRPTHRDSLILTASIAAATRDTARAVVLLERVMTMDSVLVIPPNDRKSWTALRTLTPLLLSQQMPERAMTYARIMRRIADTDSLTGTRSADVGLANLYLAHAFAAQGMRDSARVWALAAQTALRVGAGAQHAHTREAETLLGTLR